MLACFNSRSRMGSDSRAHATMSGAGRVSIHAPAWGATGSRKASSPNKGVSIHAPAWGATCGGGGADDGSAEFQFTLPHGERPGGPRGPPGGLVSIHAPAWGATHLAIATGSLILVSIHAPAWGATQQARDNAQTQQVSIHAPAWGATMGFSRDTGHLFVSIHAPAWGATRLSRVRRAY